ncbi:4'-phosphopantetheinyl transferase superfamily protein [Streptomyces sp. ODS28]|uniref:4'-phosphopantetheinyl transferase superfamily protein n=1 Tax=Streptomyces sp. ODS28 TaxID=3136688 RepID=UPI0031E558C1
MGVGREPPAGLPPGTVLAFRAVPPPRGPAQQSAAGRAAAAGALAACGSARRDVPREAGGRPRFPPGFPGSISHTARLAVATVAPGAAAVGVDIEDAEIAPRVARFVLRERERRLLLAPGGPYGARDLYAAKEAAFKALNALVTPREFVFWRVELALTEGGLLASYEGEPVPVRVRSDPDLSFAVAIRR